MMPSQSDELADFYFSVGTLVSRFERRLPASELAGALRSTAEEISPTRRTDRPSTSTASGKVTEK